MHSGFITVTEPWFNQWVFIAHPTEVLIKHSILQISHRCKYKLQAIFHLLHEQYSFHCHFPEKLKGTNACVSYLSSPLIYSRWVQRDKWKEELHFARLYGERIWKQSRSMMPHSFSHPLYHARVTLINQSWPVTPPPGYSQQLPISYSKSWLTGL